MALFVNVCICHALQRNYVKPHENLTCPDDPCMTLEAYTEAAETYFVSNTNFVFLPGSHHYSGYLRLINITNMQFQGSLSFSAEHPVQIIFNPDSNLTFIRSDNITLSNLSFTLSQSWISRSNLSISIEFRNSSSQLSNLTLVGSKGNFTSAGFLCRFSSIIMTNIQVSGAKSLYGAAVLVSNSFIILSGNNTFVNNSAFVNGGAIVVENSTLILAGVNRFEGNHALNSGGAVYAGNTTLVFSDTAIFLHNRAQLTGGAIVLDRRSTLLLASHGNVYFRENFAGSIGGAIFINNSTAEMAGQLIIQQNLAYEGALALSTSSVVISYGKSLYLNNVANDEGGAVSLISGSLMFLSSSELQNNYASHGGGALSIINNSTVIIEDSRILSNSVGIVGGAIHIAYSVLEFAGINYIEHNVGPRGGAIETFVRSTIIFIGNTYFINNTSSDYGGAISTRISSMILVHGNLSFINNTGREGGAVLVVSTTIEFDWDAHVIFDGNVAEKQGGAIYSVSSAWKLNGNSRLTFVNNFARLGGGVSFTENSKLILNKDTKIVFTRNHAGLNGGAIYVADPGMSINLCRIYGGNFTASCFKPNTTMTEPCKRQDLCFIELNADSPFDISTANITMTFLDNSADKSGAVIFGGSLDNCRLYLGGGFKNSCGNKIGREYTENPLPIILQVFTILGNTSESSVISSEPFRVCFCNHDKVPDCEMNTTVDTIRGKQFTLSAVTVGQGNFTVPSSIKVDFGISTSTMLSRFQKVQDTGNTCTNISYRLFSAESSITMILFPDGPCRDIGIARRVVNVTFLPCPDGFTHADTECVCDERLGAFNTSCNVDSGKIRRSGNNFWVMAIYDNFSYNGLLLHSDRCPFDFCVETAVEINLSNPDIQCNHNHSGILCGSCRANFSIALGSLHCLPCSNAYLALILVFALAGIALVVLLLLLQLTVVHGTFNGLIFYANIVQMNRDIFFPPGDTNILTVFIAWLNLDLGIQTCFCDRMNAYAFIWLQFVFPFYVWFLIGFIIFLSRYSLRISRWLGDNPVSVLATLFLLSYSKFLRTIVAALSRTTLQYPDSSYQYVWLYDGSVLYFQRVDHILLGVFAICALLFLFLPYTILLLTGHWMQAHSHWKIFSWINKLKPFMDTYHAPFKKGSRYWTGFLLLVRCALFLTFALNVLGNVSINLLSITSVTVSLTALAWLNQLYKKIYNDILEASFILNLCIFAAATYHIRETKGRQDKLAYTSAGIAFAIFVFIISYHIFCRIWSKLLPKQTFGNYKEITRDIVHGVKSKFKNNRQRESVQDNGNDNTAQAPAVPITVIELSECECILEYTS